MNKGKWIVACCFAVIMICGVAASIFMSIQLYGHMDDVSATMQSSAKELTVKVDKLVEEKEKEGQTQEDYVTIAETYEIRPTTAISDAYKSGDTSGLSDQDKETLELASAVIDEIITDDMTDYEKELAVYDWLTMYTSQDQGLLVAIPTTSEYSDSPYGVLKHRSAVCVGYATTFRMFMQMLDIECMVVHNEELYHSWNLVKIEDGWYHVDVYSDAGNGSYRNFNMTDSGCMNNGHNWDKEFFPAATETLYNYASQNSEELKDIYKLPKRAKKMLDKKKSNACYFFFEKERAEEEYSIIEYMLGQCQSYIDYSIYGDTYMSWMWAEAEKDGVKGYYLQLYVDCYNEDIIQGEELTEEQMGKVTDAVSDVFGEMSGGNDYQMYQDDIYSNSMTVEVP